MVSQIIGVLGDEGFQALERFGTVIGYTTLNGMELIFICRKEVDHFGNVLYEQFGKALKMRIAFI